MLFQIFALGLEFDSQLVFSHNVLNYKIIIIKTNDYNIHVNHRIYLNKCSLYLRLDSKTIGINCNTIRINRFSGSFVTEHLLSF